MTKQRPEGLRGLVDGTLRRLARDAGRLLMGSVGGSILGLIALIITTQTLGASEFGALALATTYAQIVGTLLNFQPWQALIKFGAEHLVNKDNEGFEGLVRFSFLLDAFTAIVGAIVGFFFAGFVADYFEWPEPVGTIAQWYSLTILFHVIGAPTGILRLFDAYRALAFYAVFASAFRLIGVIVVALFAPSLPAFAAAWLVAGILTDIILVGYSLRLLRQKGHSGWWRAPIRNWREPLRFATLNNLTSTLALPITHFDVMLTASLISVEATGVYKVMKQVASIFGKLADPIYQVVYPEFSRAIARNETVDAAQLGLKVGKLILAILTPVTAIAILTSGWWFSWVFGDDFSLGQDALNVYLVLKLISVTFVAIHPLFLALGHAGWNTIIQFIANTTYLGVTWVLGTHFGLVGIVLAYGVSLVMIAGPKVVIIARRVAEARRADSLESPQTR